MDPVNVLILTMFAEVVLVLILLKIGGDMHKIRLYAEVMMGLEKSAAIAKEQKRSAFARGLLAGAVWAVTLILACLAIKMLW